MKPIKQSGGNIEKFVVTPTLVDNQEFYRNHRFDFIGTLDQAKEYACNHNFLGGVEIFRKETNSYEKVK
jgi:hypothetical protein